MRKNRELRNEEGEIRIKIERMELALLEKEQSREYIRKAEEVVRASRAVRENLHPALRRELLKLIFKKLLVENRAIKTPELYEPFNAMYHQALAAKRVNVAEERRWENWDKTRKKPVQTALRSQSCLSKPSVD